MGTVFTRALSFMLVILAGYVFKKLHLLKSEDGDTLSKIILNVTLPATIIIGFNGVTVDATLFTMVGLGLLTNTILIIIGGLIWRKKDPANQALMMFSHAGYNIGNFTIPFVQGFFPQAIPYIGSFDMGNALMLFGFTPILVDQMTGQNRESVSFGRLLQRLFRSPSFTTYIVMFVLASLNIQLPAPALSIVELFASGNAFLSMFMIGLFLEIRIPREEVSKVVQLLSARYALAIPLAATFYLFLPFTEIVRLSLVLLALAPIGTVATINMVVYGSKSSLAGFVSSISIILSLILMTLSLLIIV